MMTEEAIVGIGHQVAVAFNGLSRVGSVRWWCCPTAVGNNGESKAGLPCEGSAQDLTLGSCSAVFLVTQYWEISAG